ncbi:hypothetical protein PR202_gb03917 [Eleusine coracana subsp. coracana]|uniref:DUF4408 domain-containing protein n=1 Tax=Eleusine coracana subsp. coracana TaxID=191504 RepID=A0AAV5E312_ELECO|nr:hypothetical protein QOZ80_1BG0094890 [Eleusine coracana subsp. coracana]GJN16891.1 hypothetical protein PR202_gb03917 [Eleusine coracana subsp. coracana]
MDPIIIEKISAMKKYSNSRKQQLVVLPTLMLYLVAASILCLLLTSPAWFPRLCSLLSFFLLTTLPDLATTFLLSPKCFFVVGNLIVAFLVGESRLGPRRDQPSLVNEIHEQHVKRNMVTISKVTAPAVAVADHSPVVGAVEGEEVKEEEVEEELHQRVEDFIARVKKQRKLEAKSFFDADR